MLDFAGQHARTVLVGLQEQMIPIFHLFDAEGQSYVAAAEFSGDTYDEIIRCKDAVAQSVRRLIVEHKIVQYSFMSEAWMVVRSAEWEEGMSPPPSEADDRIEVVIVTATDGKAYKSRRWRIKRDGEKCVDLALDSTPAEEARPWGRFDSLLEPL